MASSRETGWTRRLIVHLHNRDRAKGLKESPRFYSIELWIVRFETKEELVHRGPCTEIRRIEQRVIQRRETAHGQHAERSRETGPQDRPFVRRNDESYPGEEWTSRDVQRVGKN